MDCRFPLERNSLRKTIASAFPEGCLVLVVPQDAIGPENRPPFYRKNYESRLMAAPTLIVTRTLP